MNNTEDTYSEEAARKKKIRRYLKYAAVLLAAAGAGVLLYLFKVPLDTWVDSAVTWLTDNFSWLFDFISTTVRWVTTGLERLLVLLPGPIMAAVFGLLGWAARRFWFGVLSFLGFMLIYNMMMWEPAMSSLSLVLVSSLISIVIGVPLGILAAQSRTAGSIFRPVLDFMQTMPAFVYLIPAIVFFGIGKVPGVFATVIFSIPPAVRFTELGIRQVDAEMVEAAESFGASPFRVLRKIQLPLALPTVMAGINQVIMLALSMVVIAGIVGAGGLGAIVFRAVMRLDIGLGFMGGLAVVILAIYLDRLTSSLGKQDLGGKTTL